jgi:hypothetical protein
VAQLVSPYAATVNWKLLDYITDKDLAKTIKYQKVTTRFKEKISNDSSSLTTKTNTQNMLTGFEHKITEDYKKFKQVKQLFTTIDTEIILIKSDGTFPFESDNLDTLVEAKNFSLVVNTLQQANFTEIGLIREPHKFLFRNSEDFSLLPIHIHTVVEWEGTQFVDTKLLWQRRKLSNDGLFFVPGPEDCILITLAHLFFENHEIKLTDLLKVQSKLADNTIDWDYLFKHAEKLIWLDALIMGLTMMDTMNKLLYNKPLLNPESLQIIKKYYYPHVSLALRLNTLVNEPTKIPYVLSALFFLKRVLLQSNWSKKRRFKHVIWITSDIIRRRSPGREMSHLKI